MVCVTILQASWDPKEEQGSCVPSGSRFARVRQQNRKRTKSGWPKAPNPCHKNAQDILSHVGCGFRAQPSLQHAILLKKARNILSHASMYWGEYILLRGFMVGGR